MRNYLDYSKQFKEWVENLTIDSLKELLESRTTYTDSCWLYTPSSIEGYGIIERFYIKEKVHRLSCYVYHNLEYGSKLHALHKKECPNKNCWNPEHLYVGTQKDNIQDAMVMGNHIGAINSTKTHCKNGHEFTLKNTYIAKDTPNKGKGTRRVCKKCKSLWRYQRLMRASNG